MDDQSAYAPNEWPDLTETINGTTRIIPGSFLGLYAASIQDGYTQYVDAVEEQPFQSS